MIRGWASQSTIILLRVSKWNRMNVKANLHSLFPSPSNEPFCLRPSQYIPPYTPQRILELSPFTFPLYSPPLHHILFTLWFPFETIWSWRQRQIFSRRTLLSSLRSIIPTNVVKQIQLYKYCSSNSLILYNVFTGSSFLYVYTNISIKRKKWHLRT